MNGMHHNNTPLLSICIPTWNRAEFLEKSLISIYNQINTIPFGEIELYISDNCSDDSTSEVVDKYIQLGIPITYNRNECNLGAAKNFLQCMRWASGKYILLLGDDDILKAGAINTILSKLRENDYGMIHIHRHPSLKENQIEYRNVEDFFKQVSFWITFVSANIFRKEIVKTIEAEKYINTHLLQVPFFIESSLSKEKNLLLNDDLMIEGLDNKKNGGYNFYQVFVKNYLDIWKEFLDKNFISNKSYEYIKEDIFFNFIVEHNYRLLFLHSHIMSEDTNYIGHRDGLKIAGAKEILNEYYGDCMYYKLSKWHYVIFWYRNKKDSVKKILKSLLSR